MVQFELLRSNWLGVIPSTSSGQALSEAAFAAEREISDRADGLRSSLRTMRDPPPAELRRRLVG